MYGVINAVKACLNLSFNEEGTEFPSHQEQQCITNGVLKHSGPKFDKCMLTVDGMLIYARQYHKMFL